MLCNSTLVQATNGVIQNSVIINYIIHNNGAQPLEFLPTSMESLFSRLQVTLGGTIVEDHVSNYIRLATLFTTYQATDKILEQSSMQLGTIQTMTATGGQVPLAAGPQLFSVDEVKPNKIPAGEISCYLISP